MAKAYEINEKDIDSTINYLKTIDPENATPEMAIAFLEQLQASVHTMAHENPGLLEEIFRDLVATPQSHGRQAVDEVRSLSSLVE